MWVLVVVVLVVTGGKASQLILQPTKVELGLQVGVEFDKSITRYFFTTPWSSFSLFSPMFPQL